MTQAEVQRLQGAFDCDGSRLFGTLDVARLAGGYKTVGLLIVSGGNEPRCGAFQSASHRAHRIAQTGFPVFRFDRRGVGDSEGTNLGFRLSQEDIAAAVRHMKHECPQLRRLVAYGNCDAASALVLHSAHHFAALVLSNPWAFDDDKGAPAFSPQELRSRYISKLGRASEWRRIVSGSVSFTKLAAGLRQAVQPSPPSNLAEELHKALLSISQPTHILLAENDRTARYFCSQVQNLSDQPHISMETCSGADHAFSAPDHQHWLEDRLLRVLFDEEARELNMGGPAELADRA